MILDYQITVQGQVKQQFYFLYKSSSYFEIRPTFLDEFQRKLGRQATTEAGKFMIDDLHRKSHQVPPSINVDK